ncbi:hypothetical protein M0804_013630 [Polistes exclamans]|nr:hypothetical protein M0804_013630 [Polistes exclamans]
MQVVRGGAAALGDGGGGGGGDDDDDGGGNSVSRDEKKNFTVKIMKQDANGVRLKEEVEEDEDEGEGEGEGEGEEGWFETRLFSNGGYKYSLVDDGGGGGGGSQPQMMMMMMIRRRRQRENKLRVISGSLSVHVLSEIKTRAQSPLSFSCPVYNRQTTGRRTDKGPRVTESSHEEKEIP